MATEHSGSGDQARTVELLWGTRPEPKRGPKPGMTLDQISRAAIEIADAEGIGALSMRAVAKRLDVGTMSLYRYVPSKAELLDVMLDAVLAEARLATEADGGWREKLEFSAWENWRLAHRHPWMLAVGQTRQATGPNGLRRYEAILRVLFDTGMPPQDIVDVIELLDSYVQGAARKSVDLIEVERRTGLTQDQWWHTVGSTVYDKVDWSGYPVVVEVARHDVFGHPPERDFAQGLRRILDGIAADVAALE